MDPGDIEPMATQSIEQCRRELDSLLSSQEGWEQIMNKDGMQAWMKPSNSGINVVKTEGELPFPSEVILAFLMDYKRRPEYNKNIVRIEELVRFSDDYMVLTHEIKIKWPISNRDFVYSFKVEREGNRILILSKSCDGVLPEKNGVVRGDLINGSFVLEPMGDRTKLTAIFCANPNGSIPNAVKGKIASRQSEIINNIKAALSK